ncbi:MAG: type IX secretion system sortase PorU [Paludibacter sp.]
MKYKIIFLSVLFLSISTLRAQISDISSQKIDWKGIEKWQNNSASVNVISFTGAQYPSENRLPYFNKRIASDKSFSYNVILTNPVYIPVSIEEIQVIGGNIIPKVVDIKTDILYERGSGVLDIRVLPFINQDGKIMKLQSFDLQINKTKQAQKISSATRHSYASNSVLAQGRFVKIKVKENGVYKLTNSDLTSMGIDPAKVRVFGYGGAVLEQSFLLSKIDDLPEVSIYNGADYILFYAQGINRWTYDKTKSMFTHTGNPYSKYGYYFVTSDAGIGKKIESKSTTIPEQATIVPVDQFVDYQVYEKEIINVTESGKEFYGETFSDILTLNIPFSAPNAVLTNSTITRLDVAAASSVSTTFALKLDNSQTKSLSIAKRTEGDFYERAKASSATYTFTPQNDAGTLNFNLTYDKSTSATSVGYLNYLEINARRQLIMAGVAMQFQNVDNLGMDVYNRYNLSGINSNIQVWDITDPQTITKMTNDSIAVSGKFSFAASGNDVNRYLAIDPTNSNVFPKPEIDGVIPNQNLHAMSPVDMVIITHPNFVSQANTLAQAHREKDGLSVEVVTTEQVYNEFSSGAPDATAYRWVMKMLYDRALAVNNTTDNPKYLLLFGRGSYDNRKIVPNSGDNYILTYQAENSLVQTLSYVTDDYFAFLDDNEGSQVPAHLLDIGVGRFPVSTVDQANDVVNKTIKYINNDLKGNWKNQLCFLADDGDGTLHMKQADSIAVSIARTYPSYQINKIYLDAYLQEVTASGESYPLAKSKFQNLLRTGLFLLNYTGHAGASGWANESILTIAEVRALSNKYLPVWFGATCDFLQFDVQIVSAGEQVVLNPLGGGIGIMSAARPVYASQNLTINKLFCENLFKKQNGENRRIGDVLAYAKNNVGTEINKLSYIYMGDPAVKLTYPTKYQVITSKINESTVFGNDTLRALSVANIQGYIADENGVKIENFNGKIHAVLYDKIQRITTQNNHNDGALTYSNRPNTLFSGDAVVENGIFNFSVMLPKDIKYNFGTGRINYYAQDDINDFEAQGNFENFLVGGTDKNTIEDVDGPGVQLYLNSETFVTGDKVNETPLFIANISDLHGINTVGGSGIGHDVMLTIDQDPSQSYILNDNFQAAANSYTDGVVKYKLPQMINGKHTLTFRVWDLLNNSTTQSIDFEVISGLNPVIFSVSNYPNPVKTETRFMVNHDRPETLLSTTVEVFDLSGRKIWSETQPSADNLTWNLISSNGQKVKSGIYLYRVNIKTTDSDITSKTNKMVIVEQ